MAESHVKRYVWDWIPTHLFLEKSPNQQIPNTFLEVSLYSWKNVQCTKTQQIKEGILTFTICSDQFPNTC